MTELNAYTCLKYRYSLRKAAQIITSFVAAAVLGAHVPNFLLILVSNNMCSNIVKVVVLNGTFPFREEAVFHLISKLCK